MSNTRRKRYKITSFRLSEEENAAARQAADARGMGLSTFARDATLKAAGLEAPRPKRRPRPHDRALGLLVGQMGQIHSLIDGLTQQAKEGNADPSAVAAVRVAWEAVRNKVLDALVEPKKKRETTA
jgi:hypothetical protein